MSSSSDIEKLFDHFGGDANAYQEIGRENEARSARTRWPLLVTLDLTQPTIPAIGQRREVARETLVRDAAPVADAQDATPKDATSVTRAKAPLFTRSHRRDIPPVVVATQPAAPPAASRFGAFEPNEDTAARSDAAPPVTTLAPPQVPQVPKVSPVAVAPVPPAMPPASIPPVTQFRTSAMPVTQAMTGMPPNPVTPRAGIPASTPRVTAPAPISAPAPTWAQAPAPAPVPTWTPAPAQAHAPAWAPASTFTGTTAPAAPKPPASILGKLFAPASEPAPQQPAGRSSESAPLQSVFDRLRGTPAQTAAAPAAAPRAATPAASNSWLINGPRRS